MDADKRYSSLGSFALQIWLPLTVVGLWFWLSADSSSIYWPPLSEIIGALLRAFVEDSFFSHVLYSFTNYFVALAIAVVIGLGAGVTIGLLPRVNAVLMPYLDFLRSTPPVAFVPIVILSLGLGPAPKILLIAFGCSWPILLNTIEGVRSIQPGIMEAARAYRTPLRLKVLKVVLPASLPQIAVGIRVAITIGIVMVIVSEMFGSSQGVGYYILLSGQSFAVADTWAGTIFIGFAGYVITSLYGVLEHRMLRWHRREVRDSKVRAGRGMAIGAASLPETSARTTGTPQ